MREFEGEKRKLNVVEELKYKNGSIYICKIMQVNRIRGEEWEEVDV